MKNIYTILFSVLLLSMALKTQAQSTSDIDSKLRLYSSFSYSYPMQDMDKYNYSIGIYSNLDYDINDHLAFRLDIGWNDFSGPEKEYVDQNNVVHTEHPNMSVWEFTAGLRLLGGPVYLEGRGGYFTGISEWGFVPAVGFKIWKLDIQASYTFAGDKQWATARVGYYF